MRRVKTLPIFRIWGKNVTIFGFASLLSTEVTILGCNWTYSRTKDDLFGIRSEYFEGHGMSHMLCNTHKMTMSFPCVGRKVGIIVTIVDFFPEVKTKKRTNIISGSGELLYRNSINRITKSIIKYKNNIQQT